MVKMEMKWWCKVMSPLRKVWAKVSTRIALRKNGLVKLHQEVRSCEYQDVHILWDMLKRNEQMNLTSKKKPFWKFNWSKCAPLLCRAV